MGLRLITGVTTATPDSISDHDFGTSACGFNSKGIPLTSYLELCSWGDLQWQWVNQAFYLVASVSFMVLMTGWSNGALTRQLREILSGSKKCSEDSRILAANCID